MTGPASGGPAWSPGAVRAAYDAVAREYADRFSDELAHKPLDRELLARLADDVRADDVRADDVRIDDARAVVCDLGCGPGHTTAYLHDRLRGRGGAALGIDLSPALLREARARHAAPAFVAGDMLALPLADGCAAGVVGFYAIVHFGPAELRRALAEMHRVLAPGGRLLLAFHVGDETVHVDDFLGRGVALDFAFHAPARVAAAIEAAGLVEVDVVERAPYPGVEYPSRRAYVSARKATTAAPDGGAGYGGNG